MLTPRTNSTALTQRQKAEAISRLHSRYDSKLGARTVTSCVQTVSLEMDIADRNQFSDQELRQGLVWLLQRNPEAKQALRAAQVRQQQGIRSGSYTPIFSTGCGGSYHGSYFDDFWTGYMVGSLFPPPRFGGGWGSGYSHRHGGFGGSAFVSSAGEAMLGLIILLIAIAAICVFFFALYQLINHMSIIANGTEDFWIKATKLALATTTAIAPAFGMYAICKSAGWTQTTAGAWGAFAGATFLSVLVGLLVAFCLAEWKWEWQWLQQRRQAQALQNIPEPSQALIEELGVIADMFTHIKDGTGCFTNLNTQSKREAAWDLMRDIIDIHARTILAEPCPAPVSSNDVTVNDAPVPSAPLAAGDEATYEVPCPQVNNEYPSGAF